MIHLNKNFSTPNQKIDLENLLQQYIDICAQLLKEEVTVEVLH